MKNKRLVMNARNPEGFWGRRMIKRMNRRHYELTGWALEKLEIEPSFTVLDIGCGGGRTVSRLSDLVPSGRVYGIDYSELSVKKSVAFNKKAVRSGRVEIDHGSVSSMPYGDDTFDVVTGIETFYFWPDQVNDLTEVKRVLKPNGTLMLALEVVRTDDDPDRWNRLEELIGLHAPTEKETEELLVAAGYSDVKTYAHPNGWLCVTGVKR